MTRILVVLTTCVAMVHNFNNFLVQGRADTLRVLRRIIREREAKVIPSDPFSVPVTAWQPIPNDAQDMTITVPPQTALLEDSAIPRSSRLVRRRRDIRNAVIESASCEHIDLMDCSDFETNEMTCMMTHTGMTCCICTGRLRKEKWNLF